MDSEIHIAEYIKKGDKNLVYSEITFIFIRKYYIYPSKFYKTTFSMNQIQRKFNWYFTLIVTIRLMYNII